MKRKDLEKLRQLKTEADDLKKRAESVKFNPTELTTDTVNDYRTGKPIPIAITGYGDPKYQSLRQHYWNLYNQLTDKILSIEMDVANLPDAEIRQIIRLYYFDGVSQEDIAERLGYTQQTVSNRLKDFWTEYNKDFDIDDE